MWAIPTGTKSVLKKKKKTYPVKSPNPESRTPNSVRIRQSGRTGIRGVTSNPGAMHWQGIMRVLKYLRFTRDYGLHYTRYPAVLE